MNRSARAQRGLEDFWFFMEDILKMPLKEKPHREMASFLDDDTQPNKLMLVPRDCWKTSIGTMAYPLWRVLRAHFVEQNSAFRCLLDSSTVRMSQQCLELIKSRIENNDALIECYGSLYDRRQTKENWMSLSFRRGNESGLKEPHFLASGVNAAKTGLHFDLIVLDDLVTKENVPTVGGREKVWNHYRMMYGILESDSTAADTQMHIHGTRYHDDDMYGRILAEEKKAVAEGGKPMFSVMIRAAIEEGGELFYPDVLTNEALEKKKRGMTGLYWAQYMNDPNKESAPFQLDQLKFAPLASFPDKMQMIRLTCDAAIKDESVAHGDYNAIVVAGWDRFRQPWVLDTSLRRDMTGIEMIDTMLDMAQRWEVEQMIIEERSGNLLFPLIQQEMTRRGKHFPLFMVKPNALAGKLTRWMQLQPFAQRSGIHIAQELPEDTKLEIMDQWARCPFARFDDWMDAMELQLTFLSVEDENADPQMPVMTERNPLDILEGKAILDGTTTLENVFPHIKKIAEGAHDEPEAAEDDSEALLEQVSSWR